MTYKEIIKNKEINAYLKKGNENLGQLGYTDHSQKHCMQVAHQAGKILKKLGYSEHEIELAQIAGYMHDIGNCINRQDHAHSGAILAYSILKQLNMPLKDCLTITTAIGHHDEKTNGKFASAAAIRNMILNGRDYSEYVPIGAEYKLPYKLSQLDSALIYKLRTMSIDELKQINDVNEGLENRIKRLCMEYSSIDELAEGIKTKRYTRTRINRVLISALLDFTKDLCASEPSYIRVLGMNTTGMKLLSEIKKCCKYPIVTKTADFDRENPMFQAEIRATDAFSLCAPQNGLKKGGRDFTTSPVIV